MAEKEIKILVVTDTDIQNVEDLEDKLRELQQQKIQLQVESDTAELEDVNSQIEDTKSQLTDLTAKVEVDNSEIESLESELEELESQRLELDVETDTSTLEELDSQIGDIQSSLSDLQASVEVDNSEIESLQAELDELEARQIDLTLNLDSTGLEEVNSKLDETESKSQSAASSIDGVGSALTGVAAAAGLEKMVETADNINNSWNRLSLTFAGTGVSIDQLKQKQSELSASTGQTGSTIRTFFNDMGIAGVTNTELLGSAFESLAGKAYQTNSSVEEMEGKFKRMVMTGNASDRMLQNLGLTAQDLANAMGVSADEVSEAFKNMTPEERIQALTKAMGDGKQANEMYKNSFAGLKTQASAALAGLVGAIGQAILPVVIPMLKLATQAISTLTNAFKSLPQPVQQIIGVIGGMALAGVALVGVLGVVGQVIKTVQGGIQALNGIMKAWELVTKAVELAQAALNFVMAMNPIFLVIAAIIALIAILWYLYNTNEDVRNAIDGFISSLYSIGETIYGYLVGAFEYLQGAWQNTVDFFTSAGQAIQDTIGAALQTLSDIWNGVVNTFMTYAPLIAQVLFVMATGGIGAILLLIGQFMGMPTQIGGILQNVIGRITSFVGSMVSNFVSGATRSVNGFINKIKEMPSKFASELQNMIQQAINFANRIVQIIADAAARMVKFWEWGSGEHSPGFMHDDFVGEIKAMENAGFNLKLADIMGKSAQDMVKSWGNPVFGYSFEGTADLSAGNGLELGEILRLLGEVVAAIRGGDNKGNISNTFVLNGDMDSEDRMRKFIDAVIREMDWDNATAGRTIDTIESG